MTEIFEVELRVFVEAEAPDEARVKVEHILEDLDESEVWSTEVGAAVRSPAETAEYRRLHKDIPGEILSYGDRP